MAGSSSDIEREALHSCHCCLQRPPEKGLHTLYHHHGKAEIYSHMLRECFDLHLSTENTECGICEVCVGRLRDASDFKLQVQNSQAALQRVQGADNAKDDNTCKINVKLEKASGAQAIINDIKLEKSDVEMGDGAIVSVALYGTLPTSSEDKPAPAGSGVDRTCDVCQKTCRDPSALKIHRRIHTGEKPYSCKVCDKKFAQKGNLNAHFKYHMGDYKFFCNVCNKGFTQKSSFKSHKVTHTGEKPYECEECKKRFAHKSNYKAHLKSHLRRGHNRQDTGESLCKKEELSLNLNGEVQSEEKPYSCDICNKEFLLKGTLKKHLKLKHGPDAGKIYKCETCNKEFKLKVTFDSHLQTHTGEIQLTFCCEVCGKQFSHKNYLSIHMRNVHMGKKPYMCEICCKTFTYKKSLRIHESTHSEEKPYACDICNKRFRQSNTLNGHMMIHNGVKPFTCEVCGQQFRFKFALTVHVKRIHTTEKAYSCNICNKKFSVLTDLKCHYNVHTGETPYVCEICHKKFGRPDSIRKHLRRVHKEKPSKFFVIK